jgi:phage shock protein C
MTDKENKPDFSEENLFDRMNEAPSAGPVKKFCRSKNNVVIAGVCSEIAGYLNIDTAVVRLMAMMTLMFGGWSVAAYLITTALMPSEILPQQQSNEEKNIQKKENFRTVLSGLLILAGLHYALDAVGIIVSARIFVLPAGFVYPVAAIAAGIIFLADSSSKIDEETKYIVEKFYRSRSDRRLMGVCGGLGKYLDVDSSSLRIIFLLLTILSVGLFAILYFLFSALTSFEVEFQNE